MEKFTALKKVIAAAEADAASFYDITTGQPVHV
jgi:hypothetical protein